MARAGERRRLEAEDLLPQDGRWRATAEVQVEVRPLRDVLREAEIDHIRAALVATGGHRSQTAELLGISRKVLWEKLRDFDIDADEPEAEG
ncbi:MAG: helix-turn-helix domain-containing protein [Myxococcota bacterium]